MSDTKNELDAIVRGLSQPIKSALNDQRDAIKDLADRLAALADRVAALEAALSPVALEDLS
jgi:ABC-type transporter Mla subunit MlaD